MPFMVFGFMIGLLLVKRGEDLRYLVKKTIDIIKSILHKLGTPDELKEPTPLTEEQYLNLLRIIRK